MDFLARSCGSHQTTLTMRSLVKISLDVSINFVPTAPSAKFSYLPQMGSLVYNVNSIIRFRMETRTCLARSRGTVLH